MKNLNLFVQAALEIRQHRASKRASVARIVTALDGIEAKPLSFFSEVFRLFLLDLIRDGEADFVICEDKLYLLRSTIEPYLPGGLDWDDLS